MKRAQSEVRYLSTLNNLSDSALCTNEKSHISKTGEMSRSRKLRVYDVSVGVIVLVAIY